tara:strand:+ start:882 stop:1133 length:252 start_codon:yes stop_codon:yes gene_type:complete
MLNQQPFLNVELIIYDDWLCSMCGILKVYLMDIVIFVVISSVINLILAGLLIFYVVRQYNRRREVEKQLKIILRRDNNEVREG